MNLAPNAIDRQLQAILQKDGQGSATSVELDRGWLDAEAIN